MKYVNCDLCGANDYIVIEVIGQCGRPVTNVCCKMCGFVYANPVMDEKERLAFCSSDYYAEHRSIMDEKSLKLFLEEERMMAGDRYTYIHTYYLKHIGDRLRIRGASGDFKRKRTCR